MRKTISMITTPHIVNLLNISLIKHQRIFTIIISQKDKKMKDQIFVSIKKSQENILLMK